jgi:hypothetical protein
MTTTIGVSAQFGGIDAHQAILPHFHALEAALKGRTFEGFPFFELAFVLRVDGQTNAYGLSGRGVEARGRRGRPILDTTSLLRAHGGRRLADTDREALEIALQEFCAAYLAALPA